MTMTAETTATAHPVPASSINVKSSLKSVASTGSPRTVLSAYATSVTTPVCLEPTVPLARRIQVVSLILVTPKANVVVRAKEKAVYVTATALVKTVAIRIALVDR
jgi:hypothetical protein